MFVQSLGTVDFLEISKCKVWILYRTKQCIEGIADK